MMKILIGFIVGLLIGLTAGILIQECSYRRKVLLVKSQTSANFLAEFLIRTNETNTKIDKLLDYCER